MVSIGWIIVSVGTATFIAVVGIVMSQQMLRGKRSVVLLKEKRNISQELLTLGSSLVVLGIVFGTDRLIGYSFIGAGVLLSLISVIKSRKNKQRSSKGGRVTA